MPFKSWVKVTGVVIVAVTIFNQCMQPPDLITDLRGSTYAGSAACNNCHADIANNYANNAHDRSSSPANRKNISGSFHKDSNCFYYPNEVKVLMQEKGHRFYQTAFQHDIEKVSFPFDIVIGSGRKAQTYLYWNGNNAYQLPVSFSVAGNSWVNSPNYPINRVRFDRMIPIGCFECHSSYIERTSIQAQNNYRVDNFNPDNIIYGIGCERCHGPAAAHVKYQASHPAEKIAKYITVIRQLTPARQLEQCAACHSGIRETIKSPFQFKPGDLLSDFFLKDTAIINTAQLDVHGNQYQLLLASKCFKSSNQQITCITCHNPHQQERNNLQLFSSKCINCHPQNTSHFCSYAAKVGVGIVNNCIDCHMPVLASKLITMLGAGKKAPTPNMVRSHKIAVYNEISKKQLIQFISNHP